MTSPGGGSGNNLNLATLWIPIVPETSHIGEAARRAGEEMKREMMYGFGSMDEFGRAMSTGMMRGVQDADLPGVFNPVLDAISGKQALMIGVVAGAVTEGLNLVAHGVEEVLSSIVEVGEKVAETVVDIGLKFDELNKSIILFTNDSSDGLEHMQQMAREVYGQLDVGTENLGKNMAVLSKQFNLSGEDLKKLTYEITELEGRFGGFDIRSLSASMHQFGIEGKDVSDVLRTIINDSREFGISSDELQQAMVKTGPVFEQLHIGVYAASEAMAKIIQLGDQPRDILMGISKAATEMGKTGTGEDLKDTLHQIIGVLDKYKETGNEAAAQQLASTYFGPRYWAQTLQSLEAIAAAMDGVGDKARGVSIEKVVDQSRTVREEWELLQHQFDLFVEPVGDTVMKSLQDGLEGVKKWFDVNHDTILEKVRDFGHAFIKAIPDIQQFAADGIEMLGQFYDFIVKGTAAATLLFGELAQAYGTITGDKDAVSSGKSLVDDSNKVIRFDFTHITDTIGEAIRNWDPSGLQSSMSKNLDEAIEKALKPNASIHGGTGEAGKGRGFFGHAIDGDKDGNKVAVTPDPKTKDGSDFDSHDPLSGLFGIPKEGIEVPVTPVPGMSDHGTRTTTPGTHGDPTPSNGSWPLGPRDGGQLVQPPPGYGPTPPGIGPLTPGSILDPGGPSMHPTLSSFIRGIFGSGPMASGAAAPNGAGAYTAGYTSSFNWDAVAQAEASGNWANADTGNNGHYGGLQFAPATWNAFGGQDFASRPDLAPEWAQKMVADRTAFTGYNGTPPQGLGAWETITKGMVPGINVNSQPGAMNAAYMPQGAMMPGMQGGGDFGGLQQVIFSNNMTGQKTGEAGPFSGGGAPSGGGNQLVGPGTANPGYYSANWEDHTGHVHTSWTQSPSGEPYGLPPNTVISQGGPGFPDWVYELGQRYGLIASTYAGHQVLGDGLQHGIDWWPAAGGNMTGAGYSGNQEQDLQDFAATMATSAAGYGGYAPSGGAGSMMGYGGGSGGSGGSGVQLAGFGNIPLSPGGGGKGVGGGGGGGGGGHGGGGGGKTPYDPYKIPLQLDQRQDAIDNANNELKNLQRELDEANASLPVLKQKLDEANARVGIVDKNDPTYPKLHETQVLAQNAVDRLQDRIDEITNQKIPKEQRARDEAGMKAQEPLKGGSFGTGQYNAAEQLGAGFLSGIFSDLGMGNVLGGKTPDQWGIVKLLGGLAGYGVGLGNSMLGMSNAGNVLGNTGVGPGLAAGLPGIPGMPSIAKLAAPFMAGPGQHLPGPGVVAPGDALHSGGMAPFTPQGQPGSVINAPINVYGNNFRDQKELVQNVSAIQNSRAPGLYTGLPPVTMV
jgi:hypothetical protein